MLENREVTYILRFNRYYVFWEDYGLPYTDRAEAERDLAHLKAKKPPDWNWRLVERETIIRERDVG